MEIIIMIAGFSAIIFFAVRSTVKHMKGQGGCCGGGGDPVKTEEKVLEAAPIMEKTVWIEGMRCKNCENSVMRAFNRMEGVSAKASYKEKKAVLLLCHELSDVEIRTTVFGIGFTVTDIVTRQL